jgi:uncharacterized protein (DUF362 family)
MTAATRRVAVGKCAEPTYPTTTPFDPSERFPETPRDAPLAATANVVYAAVRESLAGLGLDAARFGTPAWNPLGDLVKPGSRVLLKPNLVRHENHGPGGTDCLVTHGSVVRAVLDYALIALRGSGEIWIGDSPVQSCEFEKVVEVTGLRATVEEMRRRTGIKIGLVDFRLVRTMEDGSGVAGRRYELAGDPNGLVPVNLGRDSMLAPLDKGSDRYRVTGYDCEATPEHHGGDRHEYLMSKTALDADLVVNLPKLKTHRKAGMTCALKNLVGLNGDKSWLPHHRAGSVAEGGDEYPHASVRKRWISRLDYEVDRAGDGPKRLALKTVRKAIHQSKHVAPFTDFFREGSWHGNDTIWRTVLDLNRAALYARGDGRFGDVKRPWLTVVDAVICGENEGPLRPDPAPAGVVLAGLDQALVDLACAKLAGLDAARLPTVNRAFDVGRWPISENRPEDLEIVGGLPLVPLRPSAGWLGHCEAVEKRGALPLEAPEEERRDVA